MFKQFNQRKRFNFKQMKKNFNIIEAFEQMKQLFFKRRNRSSERKRREKRENNKNEARNNARNNVENDVKNDATDETNVFMKNVF